MLRFLRKSIVRQSSTLELNIARQNWYGWITFTSGYIPTKLISLWSGQRFLRYAISQLLCFDNPVTLSKVQRSLKMMHTCSVCGRLQSHEVWRKSTDVKVLAKFQSTSIIVSPQTENRTKPVPYTWQTLDVFYTHTKFHLDGMCGSWYTETAYFGGHQQWYRCLFN